MTERNTRYDNRPATVANKVWGREDRSKSALEKLNNYILALEVYQFESRCCPNHGTLRRNQTSGRRMARSLETKRWETLSGGRRIPLLDKRIDLLISGTQRCS